MAPRGLQDGPRWAPRRSFRSSRSSKVMRPFSYTNGRITFGPTRHPSPDQIKQKQRKTRRVSWFSWFFLVASKGLPRRPQERPESGPGRPQEAPFGALTGLSIIRITPSLIDCPKRALKASKRAPGAPQERPKRAPREPQESPRGFLPELNMWATCERMLFARALGTRTNVRIRHCDLKQGRRPRSRCSTRRRGSGTSRGSLRLFRARCQTRQ